MKVREKSIRQKLKFRFFSLRYSSSRPSFLERLSVQLSWKVMKAGGRRGGGREIFSLSGANGSLILNE